jgi:hypothetical protein
MAEYVNLYLSIDRFAPVSVERGKYTGRMALSFGPAGDYATVVVSDDQARQLAEAIRNDLAQQDRARELLADVAASISEATPDEAVG